MGKGNGGRKMSATFTAQVRPIPWAIWRIYGAQKIGATFQRHILTAYWAAIIRAGESI